MAMLRLAVTTMGKVLELSAIAEPADVFLGGLGWNLQLFGYGQDIQRVERGQERHPHASVPVEGDSRGFTDHQLRSVVCHCRHLGDVARS